MAELTGSEMDRLLEEAIDALIRPSTVLESAGEMSKGELEEQINNRLDMICSGNLSKEDLIQTKAEASVLAAIRLRRGR